MINETSTIRHLADAIDHIWMARQSTHHGFVDDFCANAGEQLRHALKALINEPEPIVFGEDNED